MLWRGPAGGGAASGKIGAMIASRSRGSQYLKSRVNSGRKIATALQSVVRNSVSTLVALWGGGGTGGLTGNQRDGWSQYALNVRKTNRLGDSFIASGTNWFVGNNTARVQMGGAIIKNAPTTFDTGDIDWTGAAFSANGSMGSLTITPALSTRGLTATDLVGVYVSPAFSGGRAKWFGQYRLADTILGNSTATGFSFALPFGAGSSTNGYQVSMRIARADGRLSSPFVLTVSP